MAEQDMDAIRQLASDSYAEGIVITGLLQRLVKEHGFISDDAIFMIADIYNLSKAEVYGVVSFYHDFKQHPEGRHIIKICQAEACQSVGSRDLTQALEQQLGIQMGETSNDQSVTLEPVYCLGLCACAPAAQVNDNLIGLADLQKLEARLAEVQEQS